MPAWIPRGGKTYCTTHEVEFPRGHVCPFGVDCDAGQEAGDEPPPPSAIVAGLPTCEDHERWFVALSDELAEIGRDGSGGESGPSVNERIKAFDAAIKSRRAAVDLAKYREDWANTARIERAAKELRAPRNQLRDARAGQPAPGPVRH